jgi:signal transduction histidine kinase
MDFQTAFNVVIGISGALGLFILNNIYTRLTAAQTALEKEREDREKDRTGGRNEVQRLEAIVNRFMLDVTRECINGDRLSAALEPMNETLGEIKEDLRDVFKRLDGKADK